MTQPLTALANEHRPRLLSFEAPRGVEPRGTIIVIPGRGESPGVYERLGRRLAVDGYLVRIVPEPTDDLGSTRNQIAELCAEPDAVRPHVLIGADTGSLAAVIFAAADRDAVDGLVLAGMPVVSQRAPELSWSSELDARSACPAHRRSLEDTQLLRRGALAEPVSSALLPRAGLDQIGGPVLGLHGDEDEISPLVLAQEAYRLAPAIELNAVIGGHHDVLNDKSHRSVAANIVLFLERLRSGTTLPPIVVPLDPRGTEGRES
jgi:pimeloyl-ACP methyl ester carboxylesterase